MVKHLSNMHESLGRYLFLQPCKTKANPGYHILPENLSARFCSYNENLKLGLLTSFPILSRPPLLLRPGSWDILSNQQPWGFSWTVLLSGQLSPSSCFCPPPFLPTFLASPSGPSRCAWGHLLEMDMPRAGIILIHMNSVNTCELHEHKKSLFSHLVTDYLEEFLKHTRHTAILCWKNKSLNEWVDERARGSSHGTVTTAPFPVASSENESVLFWSKVTIKDRWTPVGHHWWRLEPCHYPDQALGFWDWGPGVVHWRGHLGIILDL